jgi:CRP-like cAMP-binding protein
VTVPDPQSPLRPTAPSHEERLFPTLTEDQIARIAHHGRRRAIARGDVLVDVGDKGVPFFVLVSGEIQVLRPDGDRETLIVTHRPGQFSGEGNMLTGRRSLARTRVSVPGEVIELDREQLLALVPTDAELSEILMRVRADGLAETMSRYLIRRIEDNPAIVLRTQAQIVALEGNGHLERVRWRDGRTGAVETNDIRHVFMMTGAVPNTGWLERCAGAR